MQWNFEICQLVCFLGIMKVGFCSGNLVKLITSFSEVGVEQEITLALRRKRSVPLKDELKFYREVSRIKPETLKLLMPNITEEPKMIQTPSPHCCFNGGTCFIPPVFPEDKFCLCPKNFWGRFCFEDVDECQFKNPCGENRDCKNTYGSYECNCKEGFVEDVDKCIPKLTCYDSVCMNFSDCVEQDNNRIICLCRLGYTGDRCERKVPQCEDSSCTEDETCLATTDGFECIKGLKLLD